jgi:hypothetical protein
MKSCSSNLQRTLHGAPRRLETENRLDDYAGFPLAEYAEGVIDLNPGWSEAGPWVLEGGTACVLRFLEFLDAI